MKKKDITKSKVGKASLLKRKVGTKLLKKSIKEKSIPAIKTDKRIPRPSSTIAADSAPPTSIGLTFATEEAFFHFFKDENLSKKALKQTHKIDDISDLSVLKFEWNTRALDDERVEKLSQSIKLRGLMEPIVIAADISNPAKIVFQCVRGHHRAEAMRTLRRKAAKGDIALSKKNARLPATVVFYSGLEEYSGDKTQKWADAASNIPELIAKDSVFARADYYQEILNSLAKGSTGKVAKSLGLSRGTIRDAINVLDLPESISQLLRQNDKILREKFIYRIASKYSKVRRRWLVDLKDKAAQKAGITWKEDKRKTAAGKDIIVKVLPEGASEKFKAALESLKKSEIGELKKMQAKAEKDLLQMVKDEIAYRNGGQRPGVAIAGSGALLAMPVAKKAIGQWLSKLDRNKTYTVTELEKIAQG